MARVLTLLLLAVCLLAPGPAAAQQAGEDCGPLPEPPACITPAEADKPFASVEDADACQQGVRNYRDAVNLHVQCRTEATNTIVEEANAAIELFNCRAEARTDCLEESQ